MTQPDRVSIVINNYNYSRFLPSAIESALGQTYRDVEVIVVDDGSTDDSRSVIAKYGDRIVPILKDNGGQASACNAGYAVSHGDVVMFLDADDLLLSTAAEVAAKHLRKPGVVKAHWQALVIDEEGRGLSLLKPGSPLAHGDLRKEVILRGQTRDEHASTSANAWSRTFLEQVMPIMDSGDRHGADEYLNTLAPVFGRIAVVRSPQSSYRVHASNFAGQMTLRSRFERHVRRCDLLYPVLQEHLAQQGTLVDGQSWKSADNYYAWVKDMLQASDEIGSVVPAGSSFILIDDNQLGPDFIEGRDALPLLQANGEYGGLPTDDNEAVSELQRLRHEGVSFVVFIRTTRWWLDHYAGLHAYLRATTLCARDNQRVVIFDLRNGGKTKVEV